MEFLIEFWWIYAVLVFYLTWKSDKDINLLKELRKKRRSHTHSPNQG